MMRKAHKGTDPTTFRRQACNQLVAHKFAEIPPIWAEYFIPLETPDVMPEICPKIVAFP